MEAIRVASGRGGVVDVAVGVPEVIHVLADAAEGVDDVAEDEHEIGVIAIDLVGDLVLKGFAVGEVADHDELHGHGAAGGCGKRLRGRSFAELHAVLDLGVEREVGERDGVAEVVLFLLGDGGVGLGIGGGDGEVEGGAVGLEGCERFIFEAVLDGEVAGGLVGEPADDFDVAGGEGGGVAGLEVGFDEDDLGGGGAVLQAMSMNKS